MVSKLARKGPVQSTTARLAQQCLDDSMRWFGDQINTKTLRGLIHHTLSLAGEVGEFANIVKKIDRGSLDINQAGVRHDLAMELTDIYIYLLNLAGLLGIDLERSYEQKRIINDKRFMEQRRTREEERELAARSVQASD